MYKHLFFLDSKTLDRLTPYILVLASDTIAFNPNHSYLSQLDVTYKTPDLMSHFLPPHEVSFTFCCSSIVFPR
ncbi:putative glutamine transport system permease protein [Streptococcus pneumoniae]|nr:putative glutamine transport system permease protein [Streptococcus pneumoniae]